MSTQNTQDPFSSLLSDPSALSSLATIISKIKPTEPAPQTNGSQQDMSGMLSAALSNPELLSTLPKLLSAISQRPQEQEKNDVPEQKREDQREEQTVQASISSLLSGPRFPSPARATDRRSALLLALKPYMSHDKAEMIDTIVKIIEIVSLIK